MSVYQEAYHLPEFTYDYEKLKIEQRGPVYICSFNDADNLNAMSYAQMAEFNDFLIKVRMDKDCRVIVLTGEGRSFCAGFNLNDLALDPPEDMGRIQRDFYIMAAHVLRPDHQHAPLRAAHHRRPEGLRRGRRPVHLLRLRHARARRVLQDERRLSVHRLHRHRHGRFLLPPEDRRLRPRPARSS